MQEESQSNLLEEKSLKFFDEEYPSLTEGDSAKNVLRSSFKFTPKYLCLLKMLLILVNFNLTSVQLIPLKFLSIFQIEASFECIFICTVSAKSVKISCTAEADAIKRRLSVDGSGSEWETEEEDALEGDDEEPFEPTSVTVNAKTSLLIRRR